MAKKENNQETAVALQEEAITTIGDVSVDINALCDDVSKMKKGAVISSDYWTPEIGETVRAVFAGMTTMKKMETTTDEQIPAIKLLFVDGEDKGKFFKNADKVLVSVCKDLKAPSPIEIECTGTKGNAGRKYKTFNVTALN